MIVQSTVMETVGPYRVVKELGRGAMGVVLEAFDAAIGRTVAIKLIRSQPLATAEEDAELKLRFTREASAAGRLSTRISSPFISWVNTTACSTWQWSSSPALPSKPSWRRRPP